MKHFRIMLWGSLVALATLFGITSALAQESQPSCADASKQLKILQDQRKTYEAKKKAAQDRIDDDRRNGRPVHQSDLDAVKEAQDHIDSLNKRIDDAKKTADAACKKEEESCGKKKQVWCNNEKRCVDSSYFDCNHCGCGVSR